MRRRSAGRVKNTLGYFRGPTDQVVQIQKSFRKRPADHSRQRSVAK